MRPLVMGVLNVTPDSFSDGGRWFDREAAIARGHELLAQGADVVDIGGESTRPGAEAVEAGEECRRVLPVVEALAPHVRVSIDTSKAAVAEAAVAAGASIVNDVSASLAEVAASLGAGWIAMHMKGTPPAMQESPSYVDVVREVREFLLDRARAAVAKGVKEVWIDPGIGFGKSPEHNLLLLRDLRALVHTGFGVVVGTSRKTFLGVVTGAGPGEPAPVEDRLEASIATAVWAMASGAAMVRVHDVAATVQAARIVGERVAV